MNLHSNIKRMDSMMIATSAKRMSRLEIIYTVNANAVKLMHELGADDQIPAGLEHYLQAEDRNNVIYYCKDEDVSSKLEKVIGEAGLLLNAMGSDQWLDFSQYQLLLRVLNEQTNQDEAGNRTAKANREISSSSLQNPSDPDATFREKAGKAHKGYVGNIVETVDENGHSLITDFAFQPNTHSDSSFCKEQIQKHAADDNRETIIADGAYGGSENQKLAEAHNVELITTALTGKAPDEVFARFVFNEAGTEVVCCPAGKAPLKSVIYKKSGMLCILMPKDCCSSCPYQKNCRAKKQKHAYAVMVSPKKVDRAQYLQKLSTTEYLKLARMRNAVEGIPSVLRRRYRVDHSPFRGKIRTGWTYALAVGAYNIRKLISRRRSPRVECAQNPAFA